MPLFNPRVMTGALAQPRPIPEHHLGLLQQWAAKVRDGSIDSLNEIQLEGLFASKIMEQVLGYTPLVADKTATMKAKQPMGGGTVDLALGEFPETGPSRVMRISAPRIPVWWPIWSGSTKPTSTCVASSR